jgi:hypothetical protein
LVHACNPSYSGGRDNPGEVSLRPYLKNKLRKTKEDWKPGSGGSALA